MNAKAVPSPERQFETHETANDRFKRSFGNWFWGSMIVATVAHFLVFQLWPEMRAADFSFTPNTLEAIPPPPEIEIPPPPERIARPATPVISDAVIDDDITIALTTFEDNPVSALPPPPAGAASVVQDIRSGPMYTPMTQVPTIKNVAAVERAMTREYPSMLRDAGIGGTVWMYFLINERGEAEDFMIAPPDADLPRGGTSNHQQLDLAAEKVADVIEFSPAMNRDQYVTVWVKFPITFQVRPH